MKGKLKLMIIARYVLYTIQFSFSVFLLYNVHWYGIGSKIVVAVACTHHYCDTVLFTEYKKKCS